MEKNHNRYMQYALDVSKDSQDRNTRTGVVIVRDGEVLISGSNRFPTGVDATLDKRHERPEKYKWIEHAERNAIYTAARDGIRLNNSTMYLIWFPCAPCARAIIQAGIIKLVCYKPDKEDNKWGEDFIIAEKLLKEACVEVEFI